jgi:hypothetical protein
MATTAAPPLAAPARASTAAGAVARAVAQVPGAGLVVLFAPDGTGAEEAQAAAGDAPVAGLSAWGGLTAGGPGDDAVAVALAPEVRACVRVAPAEGGLRGAAHVATRDALAALGTTRSDPAVLLLLPTDCGDQAEAVAGAYEVAGPRVPLAGGGAIGAPGVQLAHGRAHERAVVAVALDAPGGAAVGLADGCTSRGLPALVTRADGRVVEQLDGRPAVDVYLEAIGHPWPGDDDAFRSVAASHPLLQAELRGDVRLRHVLGRTPEGGLRCTSAIPPNAAVAFTHQTSDGIVVSAGDAARNAVGRLGRPARAALVFDCASRRRAAEDRLGAEVGALASALGPDVPFGGGWTAGEIGRTRGTKGDRNHACVVLALG